MATEPQATAEIDDDSDDGRRRQDPELLAMGRLLRIIAELDTATKSRVVEWLYSRHHQGEEI